MADAKKAQNYDTMTAEAKATFDAGQKANADARKKFYDELKVIAKYDTAACDDNCKALFEKKILDFGKTEYEACKASAKSVACKEAKQIYKDTVTARASGTKNYYSGMTEAERTAFDTAQQEKEKALESSIAAAFVKSSRPAAGTDKIGAICGPTSYDGEVPIAGLVASLFDDGAKCANELHCCGVATRSTGGNVSAKLVMCNTREVGAISRKHLNTI